MKYLEAFVIALFCAILWKRARLNRMRKREAIPPATFRTSAALGNALQVLQEFVHPHTKHVLQERLINRKIRTRTPQPPIPPSISCGRRGDFSAESR